jgi:hypothetical protein
VITGSCIVLLFAVEEYGFLFCVKIFLGYELRFDGFMLVLGY